MREYKGFLDDFISWYENAYNYESSLNVIFTAISLFILMSTYKIIGLIIIPIFIGVTIYRVLEIK